MKTWFKIQLFFIILLVWCILNESFSIDILIKGFVFSIIAMVITKNSINYDTTHLNICSVFYLPFYFIKLIIKIYSSACKAIIYIIRNKSTVSSIQFETDIKNDYLICLLANSITLTPGTVTINKEKNKLTILHLGADHEDKKRMVNEIKDTFEKLLIRSEESC